ncbi:hypothetical protein ACEWY4_003650 [Coilia grayii]|uniref:Macroglobulin domain-containing protein n=1 Tax=Coilia grayii TaxID=363190 RepID=A0ABD1KRV1_9TELE
MIMSQSKAKICASVLSSNKALLMSIYLTDGDQKKLLHQETSDKDFHRCFTIQAPAVDKDSVQNIKVEVKGQTSHWTKDSRVKFRPKLSPIIFIQTDKPLYSPGQTVHFRLVTMDTDFIPLQQKCNLLFCVVVCYTCSSEAYTKGGIDWTSMATIGQWLNVTSERNTVQLSHMLNPEAALGSYRLVVTAEWGERYTFGQPVSGKASVSLCQGTDYNRYGGNDEQAIVVRCFNEEVEMDQSGCASHVINMTWMTHPHLNKTWRDSLTFKATVAEEGTDATTTVDQPAPVPIVMTFSKSRTAVENHYKDVITDANSA